MNKVNSIREALAEMQRRKLQEAETPMSKKLGIDMDPEKTKVSGTQKRGAASKSSTNPAMTSASSGSSTSPAKPNTGAAASGSTGYSRWPKGTESWASNSNHLSPAAKAATSTPATATAKPTPTSTPTASTPATAKPGMSTLGKVGRAMPFVGAALGAADAVSRVKDGDYTGAAISAAGGLASFIPKYGTAAALGAVGTNMARDAARSSAADKKAEGSTPAAAQGSGSTPAAAAPAKAEPAKATPPAPAAAAPTKSGGANSADKAVGVVKTKGGDYNIYKKGSETAADFRNTYASATKAGAGSFKWKDAQGNERTYKTSNAKGGEYKAPTAAPAAAAAAPAKNDTPAAAAGRTATPKLDSDQQSRANAATPAPVKLPDNPTADQTDRAAKIADTDKKVASVSAAGGAQANSSVQSPAQIGATLNSRTMATARAAASNPADERQMAANRAKDLAAQRDKDDEADGKEIAARPAAAATAAATAKQNAAPDTASSFNAGSGPSISSSDSDIDKALKKATKKEETMNPMIASFLKLQEKKTGNMFEAAKKLKGDQHKLDKNKNGMLDKNDFEKLRSEEIGTGMVKKDGKDYVPDSIAKNPNMQASKDGPSKADKKALDNKFKEVAKEEVEFSAEELAHIELVLDEGRGRPPGSKNKPKEGTAAAVGAGTETNGRDPRQHIQVIAGQAAGGRSIEFNHNDGSKTTIGPAMGRKIVDHLGSMKPADRQAAVNKMHNSADHMKGM